MRNLFLLLALAGSTAFAANPAPVVTTITITTAQDDAETMARTGVLRHCGRHGGRLEGIGFSPMSSDHAIRSCCYWTSGRRPVEIGVAYSRIRRGWFAVVRYE
jgi:hypothetical protein